MSQHAEVTLVGSRSVGAGPKAGAKPTLEARDDAFHLPTLSGLVLRERLLHLPPVRALGNCFGTPPVIDGDNGLEHAQLFSTETMVSFAIVGSVGVEGFDWDVPRRLAHHRRQVRGIVARPGPHRSASDHVRRVMAQDRELGIAAVLLHPAAAAQEMAADVPAFEPCGVQGSSAACDQAALARPLECGVEQWGESPLFSRRCWAFCSVVKCGTFFSPSTVRRSLKSSRS